MSGIITAPQTGDYVFWIAVDDTGQLWLSTDETPAHKKLLCETKMPQWCKPREWDKYPAQKSASIHLDAGKKYYIEALMKEALRNDNLAVGWQLPDGTRQRPIGNLERDENPALLRRALNAAFRLGRPEDAKLLSEYATRRTAGAALRAEALAMLAEWAAPAPRDRVMNLYRPLDKRDPAPATEALRENLAALQAPATPVEVSIALAQADAKLKIKEALPYLKTVFENRTAIGELRVAALNALYELNAP